VVDKKKKEGGVRKTVPAEQNYTFEKDNPIHSLFAQEQGGQERGEQPVWLNAESNGLINPGGRGRVIKIDTSR